MANTIRPYTGDGTTVLYPVDFDLGYIRKSHIYVYLEGNDYAVQLGYTYISDVQIQLVTPVASGTVFNIRRVVPRDSLVNDYEDGAALHEGNLDNSFKQALMIQEELSDGFANLDGSFNVLSDIDLKDTFKGINSVDPVNAGDLVTLRYLQTIFLQPDPELINDLSQAYIFDTVAAYQASTIVFPTGKTIHLNDRGADFTVIAGTGSGNTFDVIASTGVNQSIDIVTNGTINLYQLGAAFEGAAATQFQHALDTHKYTTVIVPDRVTIGKHIFSSTFIKIIKGGVGVVWDDAVLGAGMYPTVCGYVEVSGFKDAVMKVFPLSGGVANDGHMFLGLGSGADIDTLIIKDNSAINGRVGVAAGFESGRVLRNRCEIYRNTFKKQNGGDAGTGYGIQYANENDIGEAYISRNTVEEAGRHSFYLARNKGGGQITFNSNKAINHRENAPTQGSQVRSALQITRCTNVKGSFNEIDGFYDSALFIAEEGEVVANPISATDIKLYATTIKKPKNTTAAIYSGYITPGVGAVIEGVLLSGITYESNGSNGGVSAPLFQYAWGRNVKVENVNIEYKLQTVGCRIFTLSGKTTTNTDFLNISHVKIRVVDSTGTFSIMRPVAPLATSSMHLEINDVVIEKLTGGAVINDWEPSVTVTNPKISVLGFSFPVASTSEPLNKEMPSLGFQGEVVHNFPSIANGAQSGVNVTVTGAVLGDFAIGSFSSNINNLNISAAVIANNIVAVYLSNHSGASVDLSSGTVRAKVIGRA
jgi:hypothetical protein